MGMEMEQGLGRRKFVYLLIGLVVVLGTLFLLWRSSYSNQQVSSEPPLVRTITIQDDNAGRDFKYAGEVRGRYESQLAFQISGKIKVRHVETGSRVNTGDLLLQLDTADYQLNLETIQAQVQVAESKRKLADDNLQRAQVLYKDGALSSTEFENIENASATARAVYDQTVAQYQLAANQLHYCNLTADQAGTVTAVKVEAGQFVTAATPVITIVQDGEKEVEISVPENRIDQLPTAANIKVNFWAVPDLTLNGSVRQIAPTADAIARTFKVRISLLDPPPDLKFGMTATVTMKIPAANNTDKILLPLSAVYQTGDKPSVWVVKDGKVSLKPITISEFYENQVQVSSGLQTGDIVVTAGVHKLKARQLVRLTGSAQ